MSSSNYGKTVILKMIKDEKELLFGTLTHPMTNEDRHDAWKEIHEKAKSLGLVRAEKSWEYLRDVTWANWKRRTQAKRDGRKKTRTGGGREAKYTDMDDLVLDIIGRDSPLVRGLNVPESITDNATESELPSIHSSPEIHSKHAAKSKSGESTTSSRKDANKAKPKVMFRYNAPRDEPRPSTSSLVEPEANEENENAKSKQVGKPSRKRRITEPDFGVIAKKQQLQLDLMEIDKRTKAIQLYKLEKKFNLPPSPFTKEFHDAIPNEAEEEC